MAKRLTGIGPLASLALATTLVIVATALALVACAPAAPPAPTAAPAKPAAAPTSAPAAAPVSTTAPAAAPAPTTAAAAKPAQVITIRAGASDPQGSTSPANTIGKFAELATQLSNGELQVQVFYTSLGIEQQLGEAVKAGSVDIGTTSTVNIARFTDAFLQFDLPFLFKNDKGYIDVLKNQPIGQKAMEQYQKDVGVKHLIMASHNYDSDVNGNDLSTRTKPVHVPADIKGLKIRSGSSPMSMLLFKSYGANPTPIDYAQVYSAMQQGVIDGNGITPIPPFASIKLYEVAKYYAAIGFANNLNPFFMNQKKFDSLTPFQQKAILDAAAQAEVYGQEQARQFTQKAVKEVTDAGVQIYHPTPAEMELWWAVREDVWAEGERQYPGKVTVEAARQLYKLWH